MYALNLLIKGKAFPRLLLGMSLAVGCISGVSAMPEPQAKATAGQIVASGIVEDSSGEPLIGATVMVAGTSIGGSTDLDGNFSIKVPAGSKLLISYVGYKPVEVAAGEHLRVVLTEDTDILDEVVVVGYGTQKKTTLTGAVGGVKGDEVLRSPVANIQQSLTGRIPGLATTVTSGEPGADDVTFWLRGAGTVNGTAPLILVDGVPRDNMRVIDPREVESISVLKDASATAVFGVRGANGVILVTTKRGKKGKLEVSASFEYSIQQIAHREETLDSYTFALLKNEGLRNDGIVSTDSRYYSDADLAAYQSWLTGDPTDPVGHPNTNWMDVLFKDFAPQTRANVVLNGGSESTQYFVSAGYTYQGGMFKVPSKNQVGYNANTDLNRYNFRSNVDHQISKYLKASLDISSYIEKVNKPARSGDNIYPWAYVLRPTTPGPVTPVDNPYPFEYNGQLSDMAPGMLVVDENGRNDPSAYGNLTRTGYEKQTRAGVNVIGNLIFDLSFITPGLSTRGLVSFDSKANTYQFAAKDYAAYYLDRTQEDYVWRLADVNKTEDGELGLSKSTFSSYFVNLQWYLNYNRTFADLHDVGAMLLLQRDYRRTEATGGDGVLPYNVIGLSGRFQYAYDSRYLIEFNMGYNGSEQFSPKKRFGFFPAVSAGWVVSNEKFWAPLATAVTNFKIRGSWGKVGNDNIGGTRFLFLDNVGIVGTGAYWDSRENGIYDMPSLGIGNGYNVSYLGIGNPDITWEVATKTNVGVDLTLFNYLTLTGDVFWENRDHMLIGRNTIPTLQGLPGGVLPKVNMGEMENHGFEISAQWRQPIGRDFTLGIGANFSHTKNKITKFDEVPLGDDYAYQYRTTGFCYGQQWGYRINYEVNPELGLDGSGFFNSQESIDNYASYGIGVPRPGDFVYQDLNDDGVIDTKDLAPVGKSTAFPGITYGFNLSANWKGFDLSCLFSGVTDYSVNRQGWGIFEEHGQGGGVYSQQLGRWSQERFEAGEKITWPRLSSAGGSTSHVTNDFYVMDGSFLRLKNLEIGYSFPSSITRPLHAQAIRVYVNGNNLLTWDKQRTSVYDIEQAVMAYPTMRVYNFGINVTF